MLDYYGSITMKDCEIDSQIISSFKKYCDEKYIQQIILDLRKEQLLAKEYSISGWNVFFKKEIYSEIFKRIQLFKNQQKLSIAFLELLNPDILQIICHYL
jgi:hypothetical protein